MALSFGKLARGLRPHAPAITIAALGCAIAWLFAVVTLRHTRPMGFPLDDSYIYLTYAKQFGRGQPFTYYPGGGYSAGSTSVLWPMVLAPFWTLGARGHALVWVSYLACSGLYAATAVACFRIARQLAGSVVSGIVAGGVVLSLAAFAFTALSGMEVAFASALLLWTMQLLVATPPTGAPRKRLIACLAATSLSRPEAMMIVGLIVGVAVLQRLRQRDLRAALGWASPLVAPMAWLVANKLFAGQLFPNTGVAKSHFYLPGFDWAYWFDMLGTQCSKLASTIFWSAGSPLVLPKVILALWIVGVVKILRWGWRQDRRLVAVAIVASPVVLMLAVIASSGLWNVQNYRYITPAFPLIVVPVGVALAPIGVIGVLARRGARIAWTGGALVGTLAFAWAGVPQMRADMNLFAQGAMDTNTQVVAIGEYLAAKQPTARVMFHDAGAVAYYGDTFVYDMLGLVTNYQAGIANNGPGARFEFLERLAPAQRPTLFAYYPAWLGNAEFFGEVLKHTPLHPGFDTRRLVGDNDMQVIEARWDHVGTAERPLEPHPGWAVVDRLDIADLASERAHGWHGELGRRKLGDPTARWSFVAREVGDHGLLLDGGRTIRGGHERFTVTLDPRKAATLVIRTGGAINYPYQEAMGPVELDVLGRKVTLPAATGKLVDVEVPRYV
ncbi:MAG: hypothetical protein NT062_03675 [Proteobacteria bacterium]|nr:hypothetical protein [Pseudomonadota bacterium]